MALPITSFLVIYVSLFWFRACFCESCIFIVEFCLSVRGRVFVFAFWISACSVNSFWISTFEFYDLSGLAIDPLRIYELAYECCLFARNFLDFIAPGDSLTDDYFEPPAIRAFSFTENFLLLMPAGLIDEAAFGGIELVDCFLLPNITLELSFWSKVLFFLLPIPLVCDFSLDNEVPLAFLLTLRCWTGTSFTEF